METTKTKKNQEFGPLQKDTNACIFQTSQDIKDIIKTSQIGIQQLIQTNKMITLGALLSGITHEVNNPNTNILLNASLLSDSWKNISLILESYYKQNGDFVIGGIPYSEIQEHIPCLFSGIIESASRIKDIVAHIKDYAYPTDSLNMINQKIDINDVIKSTIQFIDNNIRRYTDHLSIEYGKCLPAIKGNFKYLKLVFINLIQNAYQSLSDKSKGISITTSFKIDTNNITATIKDEGIGISQDILNHITDPFFTTRQEYGNVGLGLTICSQIVNSHNGSLAFSSVHGKGTIVKITLPRLN